MGDFEVHSIGTAEEIRLSRDLARSIYDLEQPYKGIISQSGLQAYEALTEHYKKVESYK